MPGALFCFSAGHSNTHPYLIWTDDLLASSPVWHLANNGIPDRPVPNATALTHWAMDPQAPRDRVFGVLYDGATGTSNALWRCDDIRNNGAWTKCLGLSAFKTLVGDATIDNLEIYTVQTSPALASYVICSVRGTATGTQKGVWMCHSHDNGSTWTAVKVDGGANISAKGLEISSDGSFIFFQGNNGATWTYRKSSTNGGHNWADATNDGPFKLANSVWMPKVSNANGNKLYSSAQIANNLNVKSTDGGTNWSAFTTLPVASAAGELTGPTDDATRFIYWVQPSDTQIWETTDGTATWTQLPQTPAPATCLRYAGSSLLLVGMGYYTVGFTATKWIATYTAGGGYVARDGNLATLFGADAPNTRFCNIVGTYEIPVSAVAESDSITATDAITVRSSLSLSESVSVADAIGITVYVSLPDSGTGLDDIPPLSFNVPIADIGSVEEGVQVVVYVGVDDSTSCPDDLDSRVERGLKGRIPSEQGHSRVSGFQVVRDRNSRLNITRNRGQP